MALTNSTSFSPYVPVAIVDFAVTGNTMVAGAVGANDATSVEGTIVNIMGMIALEVVAKSLFFD